MAGLDGEASPAANLCEEVPGNVLRLCLKAQNRAAPEGPSLRCRVAWNRFGGHGTDHLGHGGHD